MTISGEHLHKNEFNLQIRYALKIVGTFNRKLTKNDVVKYDIIKNSYTH